MNSNRKRFVYDPKTKAVVPCEHELPERDAPNSNWHGYLSQSGSVHPSQVEMHREHLKKSGVVGCEYRNDGRLVVTSRNAQHSRAKAYDCFVNDDVR